MPSCPFPAPPLSQLERLVLPASRLQHLRGKVPAAAGKVASAALEPFDSCMPTSPCAYMLGGQAASGDQGQCSSHGCAHPASLWAWSPAAELGVTMGCAGTAAKMYRVLSEGSGAGQNEVDNSVGLVEVRQKSACQ